MMVFVDVPRVTFLVAVATKAVFNIVIVVVCLATVVTYKMVLGTRAAHATPTILVSIWVIGVITTFTGLESVILTGRAIPAVIVASAIFNIECLLAEVTSCSLVIKATLTKDVTTDGIPGIEGYNLSTFRACFFIIHVD